jgi:RNA polymerase sigma-70 factor (ECF subfamily)
VARSQKGDLDAFAELYSRYFERIYGYLRVLLRDPHEAEDTVQKVFVKAFEALPSYEERRGKGFAAWLFRIARNEGLMHLRKHRRVDPHDPERLDRYRETSSPNPQDMGDAWGSDRDLARWLERLPEPQRQALTLRYMFEMTTGEIGEILDKSPEAVRKLVQRGLGRLEELLREAGRAPARRERAPMLVRLRRVPVVRARRFALMGYDRPPNFGPSRAAYRSRVR